MPIKMEAFQQFFCVILFSILQNTATGGGKCLCLSNSEFK